MGVFTLIRQSVHTGRALLGEWSSLLDLQFDSLVIAQCDVDEVLAAYL